MVKWDTLFNSVLFFGGIIAYLSEESFFLFGIIILIFLINIIRGIKNIETSMLFVVFNITFFIFLLSRELIGLLFDRKFMLSFQQNIVNRIFLLLLISLYFLMIGHHFGQSKRIVIGNIGNRVIKKTYDFNVIKKVRKISLIIMYVSSIATIAVNVEKMLYLSVTSYVDSYISYHSSLPYIIVKLADVYLISFFAYLATLPDKKESRLPLLLYVLTGMISLGTGQRNQFVIHIFMVIVYLYYRQSIAPTENWKPRYMKIYVIVFVPFMIFFLYYWGFYRNGISISGKGIKDVFRDFFVTQGKSVDLIGYAITYAERIPNNRLYSFGDVIDFFYNNVISQSLFGFEKYKQNTAEYAMNMHSFGQLITYLVAPTKYLVGGGLGSNYIAEAYVDFGVFGVAVWNLVYGWLLGAISKVRSTSWLKLTFLFFMVSEILYAPRSSASSFLASTFNLINILFIIVIFVLSRSKRLNVN